MAEDEKRIVVPIVTLTHNEEDTGLEIRVDLAGASKESVDLDMGERGFCIKADADDFRYENCFMLAHEVQNKKATAKFESGLLKIKVPFKDTIHGHKVAIK